MSEPLYDVNIAVCIVDFGDPEYLTRCLESLEAAKKYVYLDIHVHNARENNLGFTEGNNQLIHKALQRPGVDWVWLLNNDTTVPEDTFKAFGPVLEELEKEGVGVVGFKILSMEDPDLIHHAGTGQCFPNGVHKSGSVKLKQFTARTNEKWVTFASVLIHPSVIGEIGLLDGKMYNFFSDSDYCYRARYAGFKVVYEPTFIVNHKIGQSQKPDPKNQLIMMQDSLAFQAKWISGKAFFDLEKELV